ncbi:MAG: MBL fold metallo-hydrolase [Ignavibacteria bacterium]|nr:MBL fold metallo-hydrolase [Ignavibacteria bacterium]
MNIIEYKLPSVPHLVLYGIESGIAATWGYLCCDLNTKKAVVIDVPQDSTQFFLSKSAELGVRIDAIWLTHSHWDHTADAASLEEATAAPIFIHKADEYRLAEPNKHTIWQLPFIIDGVTAAGFFEHGAIVECGDWKFEILHTPGHTEGSVCFVCHDYILAIVGDTLFSGSVGRTDLPGGDTETLLASIGRELLTLPDSTLIFAGHGECTTIGEERFSNPYLVGISV